MNNVLEIRNIRGFRAFAFRLHGPNDYYFEAEFCDGTIGIVQFPVYLRLHSVSDFLRIKRIMSEVAKAKPRALWIGVACMISLELVGWNSCI